MLYHLYALDPVTGRIAHARTVEATDDGEALDRASEAGWDCTVEIWQGIRKVARLGPEPPPAAA